MGRRVTLVSILFLLLAAAGVSYYYAVTISPNTNTAFSVPTTISSSTVTPTGVRSSQSSGLPDSANKSMVIVTIPQNSGVFEGANFTPSEFTVVIGVNNTVKWINQDQLSAHSVTALAFPAGFPKFDPVLIDPGQTFTLKLSVPGTYVYYCFWHPGWLRGTI